ncbi:MAG: hypothetical protein KC503_14440, partial [Myxococcales bacterium]|nr:hypothetical protein [Myxococcales bacterium]
MSGALALLPLREADAPRCGPKAASLAALVKQGLAVPAGLCLPFASYRAAGAATAARARAELTVDAQSLAAVVAALGDRVVVRSSASCEDAEGFSAAGIFESVLGVELGAEGGGARLGRAIAMVWASLGSPAARALLADAGRSVQDEAMAVLIQRQLDARLGGHALLHADGYLEIEAVRGHPSALASGSADPERLGLARDEEPAARWRALVELLRRAALEGAACELEWLVDGRGVPWLLQRRPLRSAPDERDRPHVELDEADAARSLGRRWIWDREHNPDPLSPAHASLMQELASAERTRVVDGYLYYADDTVPPSGEGGAAMGDGAAAAAALGQAELWL